jgi:hypothetical protein
VPGGIPWQLVQESVAVGDQVPVPWQEFAQVWVAPFQPMLASISLMPLRWVAAFTVVAP